MNKLILTLKLCGLCTIKMLMPVMVALVGAIILQWAVYKLSKNTISLYSEIKNELYKIFKIY